MKEVDFQSTRKEGRGSGNVALKYSHPCGTQKIGGGLPHNSCSRRRVEVEGAARFKGAASSRRRAPRTSAIRMSFGQTRNRMSVLKFFLKLPTVPAEGKKRKR